MLDGQCFYCISRVHFAYTVCFQCIFAFRRLDSVQLAFTEDELYARVVDIAIRGDFLSLSGTFRIILRSDYPCRCRQELSYQH